MTRPADPRWMRIASRVYPACLWLYPKSLREAHGAEMRLAFRDRCREVAEGHVSAWRAFGLELLPDLLRSAAVAQIEPGFGANQRRAFGGLILLCLLAIALLTQPKWSGAVNGGMRQLDRLWLMFQEVREMKRYEKAVTSVADELVERGDPQSRALAALIHRGLFDQREFRYLFADDRGWTNLRSSEQGARASALAGPLVAHAADAYTLGLATQACALWAGCNRDLAIRRLVAIDPDNAFGWMLAFKWAAQHQQPDRMRQALEQIGKARYFENFQARAHSELFAAAERLRPGDPDLLADVAAQARLGAEVETSDLPNDVRVQCSFRQGGNIPVHWVQLHPESRADCLHLARLLIDSTDLWGASWGWRQLALAGEITTDSQYQARRDAVWLYQNSVGSFGQDRSFSDPTDHSWRPWGAADWQMWAQAWRPGDGEVPAMRRWMKARGLPAVAPANYRLQSD